MTGSLSPLRCLVNLKAQTPSLAGGGGGSCVAASVSLHFKTVIQTQNSGVCLDWLASKLLGLTCLYFPSPGVTGMLHPAFYISAQDQNSSPHAYKSALHYLIHSGNP